MDKNVAALARAYAADPDNDSVKTMLANAVSRSVSDTPGQKILISGGYGAGWSTWSSGNKRKFMLTHPGLIKALEAGESLTEDHPAVEQFLEECERTFGDTPYMGGLSGLHVVTVKGPFCVDEYDGAESVVTLEDFLREATVI